MQKIKPLLDQASKELRKGSSASLTEVGQNRTGDVGTEDRETDAGSDYSMDRVDAINQIFAEFEFAYHNQFHKAFANLESQIIAKKYWLSSFEHYSARQIVQAAKRVIQTQDYLPSIAVLVRACEQGFDLFGLVAAKQAYLEACSAPSPKRAHKWSHEAVYLAGKSAGWYLLANQAESSAFPLFEYHYDILCRRVLNGEELAVEQATALAEKVERKLDKSEVRARIAKLKQDLAL